jgi:hypothetical protein
MPGMDSYSKTAGARKAVEKTQGGRVQKPDFPTSIGDIAKTISF